MLHNALHHPDDVNAPFDLQRVDALISILARLAEMKENREVLRMYIFCAELKRRAGAAVKTYEAHMDEHQVGNRENAQNPVRLLVDSRPHKSAVDL